MATHQTISLDTLHQRLYGSNEELALLDVGEDGEYGTGHLLRAVHAPYSQLESVVPTLVPRRTCPIVLLDHGYGVAQQAAMRLQALGYTDLAVLAGGAATWQQAHQERFHGVFVPSKAFGEWVEHQTGTPSIDAPALAALQADHADHIVLDPRTFAEYQARHIPGAISCPGAELVYRFHDLVPSPTTQVIVACGGRTRGIIGAQSLIEAGVSNPVAALADGTHGWQLAGLPLEQGPGQYCGSVSATTRQTALAAAAQLRQRQNIPVVDSTTLQQWLTPGEQAQRTTFVLDVRTPAEFARGSLPAAANAPGGQLVQATDRWLGTWRARVVLVDNDGVRASMTAHWLRTMGWDAWVAPLAPDASNTPGESGPIATNVLPGASAADTAAAVAVRSAPVVSDIPELAPDAAARLLIASSSPQAPLALSLDSSQAFLTQAPCGPGWEAHWASRARLTPWLAAARAGQALVLFSSDGNSARLAALDLIAAARAAGVLPNTYVVRGGLRAWIDAGLPVSAPAAGIPDAQRIDTLFWASTRRRGDHAAMQAYLAWEKQLLAQVRRAEPGFPFPWNAVPHNTALPT